MTAREGCGSAWRFRRSGSPICAWESTCSPDSWACSRWSSYLFIYTPLKRVSPISTTIGAIPGAMPPLIGYAAASGRLNFEAGILYAILFLWQFPHFYAIAWMYREDYARAGIRMLPGGGAGWRFHRTPHRLVFAGAGSDEPGAGVFLHGRQRVSVRSAGFGRAGLWSPDSARPRNIRFCGLARCCWRAWFIFLCCMASWSSTARGI